MKTNQTAAKSRIRIARSRPVMASSLLSPVIHHTCRLSERAPRRRIGALRPKADAPDSPAANRTDAVRSRASHPS
jgi:hypothetical protein